MDDRFYRSLYRIRRVEEEIARIYPTDKIKSPIHLSIGQEAVSVGICEALQPEDVVFGTYRSHALYLAKGGDLKRMLAELYGKATGCAKGKGGSMHLVDVAHGVMGASAVVGTAIPQAVGYAYALKLQGSSSVVVSVFGDGATDEGVFHESLNFAALKRLPVLFVCENNQYAIHTHQLRRHPLANVCEHAQIYGIPAQQLPDEVCRIHEAISGAAEAVRAGRPGPFFFECLTYRWKEHVGPGEDFQLGYRTREEAEPWYANDQVKRIGERLDESQRRRIEEEVEQELREAVAFAEESPAPAPDELWTDVFKAS
ncbi:MAG: acetoin dehydrogenase [Armatimonadetes bacterium CG_4_10_14_0_8_um_filter_66_14]|nr:MAG: acetoin dehydrogenase [Armatimonadetes bacterium CG_4_10_14_3_um_filter_59_10]PIZ35865.1 MAG: acetoin dehydrogenase [Armatimonadetes bacterium CG_4_10_14_0_8_um_filter_66_14]PJB61477.1 MAG: acetoin dehydrogenase [Armatimonadetes bacterium CG_4_9_14_3_um_filter_66_14]